LTNHKEAGMFYVYKNSVVSIAPASMKVHKKEVDVQTIVAENSGGSVSRFISRFGNPASFDSLVVSTSQAFNIAVQPRQNYRFIVNLQNLNSVNGLCGFLCAVNRKLEVDGCFVCCLETTRLRRHRIYRTSPSILGQVHYFFDYLTKRVMPGINAARWLLNASSLRRNKPVSFYEMLGRLAYCGFETEVDEVIHGRHYLVVRKVAEPPAEVREDYGFLLKLNRVGKDGKSIRVFKFRTMVAFSEYLQEHIYRRNHLCKGGKFKDDRRVTLLGAFVRRYWIDELPMIYNVLRGDMKLVGVRPVSPQYLSLYDSEVVKIRTSVKPGLIPPFYADMPETLEEIQASEVRYVRQWHRAPLRTDFIYFFKALRNILFRGARSK